MMHIIIVMHLIEPGSYLHQYSTINQSCLSSQYLLTTLCTPEPDLVFWASAFCKSYKLNQHCLFIHKQAHARHELTYTLNKGLPYNAVQFQSGPLAAGTSAKPQPVQ